MAPCSIYSIAVCFASEEECWALDFLLNTGGQYKALTLARLCSFRLRTRCSWVLLAWLLLLHERCTQFERQICKYSNLSAWQSFLSHHHDFKYGSGRKILDQSALLQVNRDASLCGIQQWLCWSAVTAFSQR